MVCLIVAAFILWLLLPSGRGHSGGWIPRPLNGPEPFPALRWAAGSREIDRGGGE
jgi:hypothetical protein